MVPPAPAAWIDRPADLEALAARLARVPRLALDTEANSLHAYRERTCVVQVSTDTESAIIDPLALPDLAPLRAALDRPDLEVVFHGGDYDISVLSRDHAFRFTRVFDTMIAATLCGVDRVGLADLVGHSFGVELDKRYQKCDWALRPVTPEQLVYLQGDTQWLLPLRDLLAAGLTERDLEEEAAIEFRRLATRQGKPLVTDPEGWRRAKGVERLGPEACAVLHELWAWRESEAERHDQPPFKVLAPQALIELAQRPPRDERAPLVGVFPREASRHGAALRAAVARGLRAMREGRGPATAERPHTTEEQRAGLKRRHDREDALKNWRRSEAATRGVPNVVVLPNPGLEWLLGSADVSLETLTAHPDIGPKRAARYGAAILSLLSGSAPPQPPASPN